MPFSSLSDPVDIARAHSALDRAWTQINTQGRLLGSADAERARLATIIAGYAPLAVDEDDLIARAIERFSRPLGKPAASGTDSTQNPDP